MIKMMNTPLAALLASSGSLSGKDAEDNKHPWLSLQKSLASLGASSFVNGAQSKPMPAEFSIPQVINQCTNVQNKHASSNRASQGLVLKDNSKFMVTDNLQIFESSTIKAMELMKEHVDDFRGIQTATVTVNEDYVRKFILCGLLGSKKVFTQLFPDGGESDGSFEAIDPPKKNGTSNLKGK